MFSEPLVCMLRNTLYSLLGAFGDEKVVTKFKQMFIDHVNGTQTIDTDIRHAVYSTVGKHGDAETLKQMKQLYFNKTAVDERCRLLKNLGRTQDDQLRKEVLEFSISVCIFIPLLKLIYLRINPSRDILF